MTFWLSVLKLQFNLYICILDFHVLIFQLHSICDNLDTELKKSFNHTAAQSLLLSHFFSISTHIAKDSR